MRDVDLRLILIVHLIQNQLVFIKKLGPLGFVGFPKAGIEITWDYSGMSS